MATMSTTRLITASALTLVLALGASQASARIRHPQPTGRASAAQLQREHNRAVKAGDTANDPYDSSSSDNLNQQELATVQAAIQGTAPSYASAPMTDANTGVSSDTSATADTGNTGVSEGTATTGDNTNNNVSTDTDTTTLPPADQPATPDQGASNGSTSMPSSTMPTDNSSMPQSNMPTSQDTNPPQQTTTGNDTTTPQ